MAIQIYQTLCETFMYVGFLFVFWGGEGWHGGAGCLESVVY